MTAREAAELQLSELEVEGDDSSKLEMRGSLIQVALPVNGTVVTPITATLAPGTYTGTLNIRDVETGIYTYHQMASVYTRRDSGALRKIAAGLGMVGET